MARPLLEKPIPVKVPMQYASGYSLDLYCDHSNYQHGRDEFPHQFTGETFAECAKIAKRVGWIVHRKTRTATCPKCSKRRQNSLPVSYMDDVTEQQVRKIDELVREEFDSGDWLTVEKEKR
jgi:hypothetical protein